MQALRDICAGTITIPVYRNDEPIPEMREISICGKTRRAIRVPDGRWTPRGASE
jgi:hypothetical protein